MCVVFFNFVEFFKFLNDYGFVNCRGIIIYNYIMEFININCFEYYKNGCYFFIFIGFIIDLLLRCYILFLLM